MPSLIDELNTKYFDGGLPQSLLKYFDLDSMTSEDLELTERLSRFMKMAGLEIADFSELQAWFWGSIWPRMSVSIWGGMIPPLTLEGRHEKIDAYIRVNPWTDMSRGGTLLDLGCGYPPHTSVEAAERFPDWQVVGADPELPGFLVYDELGNYAAFGPDGEFRYFQSGDATGYDLVTELYRDPAATKERFGTLYERLLSNLPDVGPEDLVSVEKDGARLIKNPIREYELSNLSFIRGGIGEVEVEGIDCVRCFNVLMYFDLAFRDRALAWIPVILKPGGVFICGHNTVRSA